MFSALGRLTATHPWKICLGWLLLGGFLTFAAPSWDSKSQDDDIHFLPERCDSVRGYRLMEKAFPNDVSQSRVVLAVERADRPLDDEDFALVDRCVAELNRLKEAEPGLQISRVYSHRDAFLGKRLVSEDRQCTLIQVALGTPFLAAQTQATVDRTEETLRPLWTGGDPPRLLVTGPAGVGRDLVHASSNSLDSTTLATILLVVVVLLMVYRAPLLALVPLATIGVSVWVALKLLALLTLIPGVYLVNVSKVFAIVLLYGAGTDYCLFLISRYREELMNGHDLPTAIRRGVRSVGGALAASAGTVICGLGLMGTAEFAKVRCAGPAIALGLGVALAASLTLTPALLRLLGTAVFWPRSMPRPRLRQRRRPELWARISAFVVARPVLIWTVSLGLLLPLAVFGLRVRANYKPTGELSPDCQSIAGLDVIQKHFTPGEVGPITVLLTSSTDWTSREGQRLLDDLSRGFAGLDNVAEVRSLTQPLGTPLAAPPAPTKAAGKNGLLDGLVNTVESKLDAVVHAQALRVADQFFVARLPGDEPGQMLYVTRLDVVLRTDPFAPESAATLGVLQTWLREELPQSPHRVAEVGSECYGVTVNARDLAQVTEGDRGRVNLLVLGAIFVILLVLTRRLWLAAYLLVTVLLSYVATLGATALAGALWNNGRPLEELDWRVPFFLFTILVAVGEDYNILLITRALQERRKYGTNEGVRRALARTGGTITSCGLIMAGTFATLMLAHLGTLVQIGFALAFGVLLDTFVVRPFLVPAFALLVWRRKHEARQGDEPEWVLPRDRRAA